MATSAKSVARSSGDLVVVYVVVVVVFGAVVVVYVVIVFFNIAGVVDVLDVDVGVFVGALLVVNVVNVVVASVKFAAQS